MKTEIWKDCKGYEGLYQVSSLGRVWSVRKQRYLSQNRKTGSNEGYMEVVLIAKNGKKKYERVHRLVAIANLDNLNSFPVVNHLNGIKDDNRVENLEWTTVRGNTKHAIDNDLGGFKQRLKEMTDKARLSNTNYYEVWKDDTLLGTYYGLKETAKAVNVNEKTIRNCLKENRASRDGYRFICPGGDIRASH